MPDFTPVPALVGGVLIGVATSLMLVFNGRVAGVSNIVGSLLTPQRGDVAWRLAFVGGLIGGGVALLVVAPEVYPDASVRPTSAIVASGLLVGFGTRMGGGCTSGHGVCGNSRLSPRSMVATVTFIATGMATVLAWRTLLGAAT